MIALPTKGRRRTDWARVDAATDKEIDAQIREDEDTARHLDKAWFEGASSTLPEPKVSITIRVDKHVVDWFKGEGPGYQTRMNSALAAFVSDHKHPPRTGKRRG